MKLVKMKLIILFLIVISTIHLIGYSFVNADTNAPLYGFQMDDSKFYDLGWVKKQEQNFYHDDKKIGVLTTYTGVYKSFTQTSDGHNVYCVLVKQIMSPCVTNSVYGFSDDSIASCQVNQYRNSFTLANYSPQTQSTSSSYTASLSIGNGISFSATATVNVPHIQDFYNTSNTSTNYFCFECDYYIATNAFCNKSYIKQETSQFCMFFIEDFNNAPSFRVDVVSYGRFAYASSCNFFTCVRNDVDFYTKSNSYILNFQV